MTSNRAFCPHSCDEHGFDDAVGHGDSLIVALLLVVRSDAHVVRSEFVLGVQGAEEYAVKGRLADGLQNKHKSGTKCKHCKTYPD